MKSKKLKIMALIAMVALVLVVVLLQVFQVFSTVAGNVKDDKEYYVKIELSQYDAPYIMQEKQVVDKDDYYIRQIFYYGTTELKVEYICNSGKAKRIQTTILEEKSTDLDSCEDLDFLDYSLYTNNDFTINLSGSEYADVDGDVYTLNQSGKEKLNETINESFEESVEVESAVVTMASKEVEFEGVYAINSRRYDVKSIVKVGKEIDIP